MHSFIDLSKTEHELQDEGEYLVTEHKTTVAHHVTRRHCVIVITAMVLAGVTSRDRGKLQVNLTASAFFVTLFVTNLLSVPTPKSQMLILNIILSQQRCTHL